jgi:hypothetical protein
MKEIKAKEGYYLTQVGEVENRMFLTSIKGMNVREEDWRLATEEEKIAYEEQAKEKLEEDQV